MEAEVVKVPHHGSSDFDADVLKVMKPVVWLISSGDENARKEYIHPRADLMNSLGRASRQDGGVIFCTELAAFFDWVGPSIPADKKKKAYFGYNKTVSGIIHVRTDGHKLLVFSHSAKDALKEAYGYNVDDKHKVTIRRITKQ